MAPISAAGKERAQTILEASSPWNVNYGEEQCRLSRVFGPEDQKHLIFFEQWGPGSDFGFTAAGPSFDRFKGARPTYWRTFDGQEPHRTEPFRGNVDKVGSAIIYSALDLESGQTAQISRRGRARQKKKEEAASDLKTALSKLTLQQLDEEFAAKAEYISVSYTHLTLPTNREV